MKILILGASGTAGKAILQKLEKQHTVFGTYCAPDARYAGNHRMLPLNISDSGRLPRLLKEIGPEIVISCLRGDFEAQLTAHRQAAGYLKERPQGRLLFLSTANVFDKSDDRPHLEEDIPLSESDYGQFKIACEQLLQEALGERAVILRLPFVWSREGTPRLEALLEKAGKGKPVPIWSGLYTNHTTDAQIADFTAFILEEQKSGIFHVGTDKTCEYKEFTERLFRALGLPLPAFAEERLPAPSYLAVLSGRRDIPENLSWTTEKLLDYIRK